MAGKTISIMDVQQLIDLKLKGTSNRKIAELLRIGRNTVNRYVALLETLGSYEELAGLDEADLNHLLTSKSEKSKSRYQSLADWFPHFYKELKKPGCTLQALWIDYKNQHPDGYQYTQFAYHYSQWVNRVNASQKLTHRAGQKTFFDFAGKPLYYFDRSSGRHNPAQVWVAILPCSQYIYVQALESQNTEDIVTAVVDTVEYFGGVTQALIPDNMKAIVTQANRYEPVLTKTFKDLAVHYNVVIDPARPYQPQDKALVENAVHLVYQHIYYPISNMQFFSVDELNKSGIFPRLDSLNERMFSQVNYSRRELFMTVEKPHLQPLPASRYQIKQFRQAKVQKMGCVLLYEDKHYYGVPYRYIGQKVELRYNRRTVEIYHHHKRLWSYKRDRTPGGYTIAGQLRSQQEKKHMVWDHDYFYRKARRIGPYTGQYVSKLIRQYDYVDMGCKQAMGIIHLIKQYDRQRVEKACRVGLAASWYTYRNIHNMLVNKMEQQELPFDQQTTHIPDHHNVRGPSTYE